MDFESSALPTLDEATTPKALKYTIPEHCGPPLLQLAYGRRAIPKLISELSSENLITSQHALINLSDLLHNPKNVAGREQIHRVIHTLTQILQSHATTAVDITVRQKVTACLSTISACAHGRNALISQHTLRILGGFFDDQDYTVRWNVFNVFSNCSAVLAGVYDILPWGCVAVLVRKLGVERVDIQGLVLDTLYNCFQMGAEPWYVRPILCCRNPSDALQCKAMQVFTDLLTPHAVTLIKVGAARCIMALSFYPEGKKAAIGGGKTISVLLHSLGDLKAKVRAAAAGALMSISIDVDAKRLLVRENALSILTALLDDANESVLLNVIKTITNCAEDYRGRFQLHGCVKRLEEFSSQTSNQQLAEAATRAIVVITWRP